MAKKPKAPEPTKAEVHEAVAEIKADAKEAKEVAAGEAAVTVTWLPIVKLWSVQMSAVTSAVAAAYASSADLQAMISASQFASGIAIANLIIIVLRTIAQGSTAT